MTSQVSTSTPQRREVPRYRDPQQRFDPEAEFVWRKRVRLEEGFSSPGDLVRKDSFSPTQLLNLWRASRIELATDIPPADPSGLYRTVDLAVAGRGCYTLTVVDENDEAEEYKARGLGNLLQRAGALGVRERVLSLLAKMKEEEATAEPSEPDPPHEPSQEAEEVETEGEAGDEAADSDLPSPADFGEGESGALDGGGGPEGSVAPADSPVPKPPDEAPPGE